MGLVKGDRLGPYEIIAPIGAGGMGEVYKARDTRLKREVAVKVLPPAFSEDPDRLRRFTLEAQAVAALSHPNILAVYDVGEHEGSPYIVMELLEGESLRRALRGESLPARKAVEYAVQIAQGLGAAHQKGIVHRDLKPENVFVSKDGRVKILDFGLARVAEATSAEANLSKETTADLGTGPGIVMGTVSYMSPEQARGLPADARSDIFSFGVVLYEMLSGKRAFGGDTGSDVMAAILKEEPAPLPPSTPPVLDKIVRQCIQKRPEERFSSAHDLALALQAISGSEAVSYASQAGAGHPRRRAAIFVAIAALLLLTAAVLVTIRYTGTGKKKPPPFERVKISRLTRGGMAGWQAAISPDGRYVAYTLYDEQNRMSLWVQQIATSSAVQVVPPTADGITYPVFSPDGNYVYYLTVQPSAGCNVLARVPSLGGAPEPQAVKDIDTAVTFSPDGKRLAYVRCNLQRLKELRVANADGSDQKLLAVTTPACDAPFINCSPGWSPDGKTIVWVRNEGDRYYLQLVDVGTGQARTLGSRSWDEAGALKWLPDGRGLLLVALDRGLAAEKQIWLVEFPTGAARPLTSDVAGYLWVDVSADGASLVSVRNEVRSNLWVAPVDDLARAVQVTRGYDSRDGFDGLAWTPGGGLVYASKAGGAPDLWLLEKPGGQARRLTHDPFPETYPSVSPDGRTVVYAVKRPGAGQTIWRMDADGGNPKQLSPGPRHERPIVTPDGRWVLYASWNPLREYRVPIDGGSPEAPCGGDPEDDELFDHFIGDSISPDGRTLAGWVADQRGVTLSLVPLEKRGARTDLLEPGGAQGCAVWAPDGRSLLYVLLFGSPDIWRKGLDKTPPRRVTDLKTEIAFKLAVSRDGQQLAFARGQDTSDVVLIQETNSEEGRK